MTVEHLRQRADRRNALQAVFEANATAILAYLERRADPDRAADVFAETVLVLWRRIDDVPRDAHEARLWAFVVARNTLANATRADRRRRDLTDRLREQLRLARATDPGDALEHVREAVDELPEPQRELVKLVHWDGFSIADAARLTGATPSTARTRYARARTLLRQALGQAVPTDRRE